MGSLNAVRMDMDKAAEGVFVDYAEGIRIKIASSNSASYKEARRRLLSGQRKTRGRMPSGEQVLDLLKPAIAKHLVLDWEGLTDDNDTEIPFSYDTALRYFNDPGLSDFFDFIIEQAGSIELFQNKAHEAEVKN